MVEVGIILVQLHTLLKQDTQRQLPRIMTRQTRQCMSTSKNGDSTTSLDNLCSLQLKIQSPRCWHEKLYIEMSNVLPSVMWGI